MKTFKFWFEPADIPDFKKLCWKIIDVPLADVLKNGIHPWQGNKSHHSLVEKFTGILNQEECKPAGLIEFKYCSDVSSGTHRHYYSDKSQFEEILERISGNVYFVDNLSYIELLEITKRILKEKWSHQIAYHLLRNLSDSFDSMRSFLKKKDPDIKLSGYNDIDGYNLARILSPDDFYGEDAIIISEIMGTYSFRSIEFLKQVTDNEGRLKLAENISHFQMTVYGNSELGSGSVLYNCTRNCERIRFVPEIPAEKSIRGLARNIAEKYRLDKGSYCFDADINQVENLFDSKYALDFSSLNYLGKVNEKSSFAKVNPSKIEGYAVGKMVSYRSCNETIKEILKNHGMSMTGRKEELFDKLVALSAEVYKEHVSKLDEYFSARKFIKVDSLSDKTCKEFPLLNDLDIRNMILSMYIIKHLRGNVILEASHNNDTFDLLSLAQALIKEEVDLMGYFLRVE